MKSSATSTSRCRRPRPRGTAAGDRATTCSRIRSSHSTSRPASVWHFQTVHHDLWDWDNIGPPMLGEITVDGKRIRAVMQANKVAFLYVLDRITGRPVWPIEERPVPQSTVPGEHSSPTQPFSDETAGVRSARHQRRRPDRLHAGAERARANHREAIRHGAMFTAPSVPSAQSGGKKGKGQALGSPKRWSNASCQASARSLTLRYSRSARTVASSAVRRRHRTITRESVQAM
jgi:hypothetical protein